MVTVVMIPNADVSALNASVTVVTGEGTPYRVTIGRKTPQRTLGSGAGTVSRSIRRRTQPVPDKAFGKMVFVLPC